MVEKGQSPKWSRDTPWRQGHVLCAKACATLDLHHDEVTATCVVVISHDCDLANDNMDIEPHVETIIGRVVSKANGNYSWGKAPRTLHLQVQRNGHPITVELVSTRKHLVLKRDLANFVPDCTFYN